MNIQETVIKIISSKLHIEQDVITPDMNIKDELGADSLDIIEILNEIEKELSISLYCDFYESVITVRDIIFEVQKVTAEK